MEEPKKVVDNNKMLVVGINLLILTAYTIFFRLLNEQELVILIEAIFIFIHVVLCLVLAIFVLRKEFLFSALVVLLIGFSSCWVVFGS